MKFVYTPAYARTMKSEAQYLQWLSQLKLNDEVLVQTFIPSSSSSLSFNIERWAFETCQLKTDSVVAPGVSHRFCKRTGKLKYNDSDADWGDVFPGRVVPCHPELVSNLGESVYGNKPIYEPLYLYAEKMVFLVPTGTELYRRRKPLRDAFDHQYVVKCSQGELHHCFYMPKSDEDLQYQISAAEHLGAKFLYSEYCD